MRLVRRQPVGWTSFHRTGLVSGGIGNGSVRLFSDELVRAYGLTEVHIKRLPGLPGLLKSINADVR